LAAYLQLFGVCLAASLLALICEWLYIQVLLYAIGLDSRVARIGIGLSGFGVLIFVPISIEHLRIFIDSGWLPRIWWGVCMLASPAPILLRWPHAKRRLEPRRLAVVGRKPGA